MFFSFWNMSSVIIWWWTADVIPWLWMLLWLPWLSVPCGNHTELQLWQQQHWWSDYTSAAAWKNSPRQTEKCLLQLLIRFRHKHKFHFIRMLQVGGQVRLNFRTVWINKYVMTTFKLQVSLHSCCSCLWFSRHKVLPRTSKFENDSDFVSGIHEKWPQLLVKDCYLSKLNC